eukprot:Gregarina_sp_Poly_1__4437@NODE_2393_length_2188_cov_39_965582_g1522_i0_p1_GENE_NODE_2393_length_2188_cov_39_965582_g1522_i0NODE_2393_length_2188_cov_39_965582_g1522_i0_p1_ORF_typecomplete_len125_score17_90_NODE_2393_length_2188_cov_39_965582_g1522_i09941368
MLPGYVVDPIEGLHSDHIIPILIQVKNRGEPTNEKQLMEHALSHGVLEHFEPKEREDGLNTFWLVQVIVHISLDRVVAVSVKIDVSSLSDGGGGRELTLLQMTLLLAEWEYTFASTSASALPEE